MRYYGDKSEILGSAVLHLTAVGKPKRLSHAANTCPCAFTDMTPAGSNLLSNTALRINLSVLISNSCDKHK